MGMSRAFVLCGIWAFWCRRWFAATNDRLIQWIIQKCFFLINLTATYNRAANLGSGRASATFAAYPFLAFVAECFSFLLRVVWVPFFQSWSLISLPAWQRFYMPCAFLYPISLNHFLLSFNILFPFFEWSILLWKCGTPRTRSSGVRPNWYLS